MNSSMEVAAVLGEVRASEKKITLKDCKQIDGSELQQILKNDTAHSLEEA